MKISTKISVTAHRNENESCEQSQNPEIKKITYEKVILSCASGFFTKFKSFPEIFQP